MPLKDKLRHEILVSALAGGVGLTGLLMGSGCTSEAMDSVSAGIIGSGLPMDLAAGNATRLGDYNRANTLSLVGNATRYVTTNQNAVNVAEKSRSQINVVVPNNNQFNNDFRPQGSVSLNQRTVFILGDGEQMNVYADNLYDAKGSLRPYVTLGNYGRKVKVDRIYFGKLNDEEIREMRGLDKDTPITNVEFLEMRRIAFSSEGFVENAYAKDVYDESGNIKEYVPIEKDSRILRRVDNVIVGLTYEEIREMRGLDK